ncbi:MAG: condensation domain-containing protein, partial [Leadbetterella sp.]|nr:condensation domain-containing protein [Leadbetterella sp.]
MKKLLEEIGKAGLVIEVVNEELKIYSDGSQIDPEFLNTIKAKKNEIIKYLIQNDIGGIYENQYENILPALTAESYAISDAQRRLWILSQFEDGSVAYNMPGSISLSQDMDIESFKRSIDSTIDRHEVLRTVFKEDESGEIRQWVKNREELGFTIDYKDFRDQNNKHEQAQSYVREDSYKAFDLEKGPLLRAGLIQLADDDYIFYFNMHHIIGDGWSMEVLSKDVFSYYEAYKENKQPELKELRI